MYWRGNSRQVWYRTKEIPLRPLNKKAEVLRIEKTASGVTINGANVVAANIRADNGIFHIIDTVLLPK